MAYHRYKWDDLDIYGIPLNTYCLNNNVSMTSNTIIMPKIQFIANMSKMGDRKLVIYIPAKQHEIMRKLFEGKPMLITCQEAIPETNEEEE